MTRQNCWDFMKCGRQPGGPNTHTLGECIAATESRIDGINGGKNGGRACWALAGTLCGGRIQGTYATKLANCLSCQFYELVRNAEAGGFMLARDILDRV